MNALTRNKLLVYINSIFGFEAFFAPVVIIYYQQQLGLSLLEISAFFSIVATLSMLLEIPSGILSDLVGRKTIFIAGRILYILGLLVLLLGLSEMYILIAILMGSGIAFYSGNLQAIVFNDLKSHNQEHHFYQLGSRATSLMLFSGACAAVIGGYVADIDIHIPLLIDTLLLSFSTLSFVFLAKSTPSHSKEINYSLNRTIAISKDAVSSFLSDSKLVYLVLFSAITFSYLRSSFNLYQPSMVEVNLDLSTIGIFFALMNLFAALSSSKSEQLTNYFRSGHKVRMLLILLPVTIVVVLYSASQNLLFVLGLILLQQVLRGWEDPFTSFHINNRIQKDDSRTTILSIQNAISTLFVSGSMILVGMLADIVTPLRALALVSIVFIFLIFILILSYFRSHTTKDSHVKPDQGRPL